MFKNIAKNIYFTCYIKHHVNVINKLAQFHSDGFVLRVSTGVPGGLKRFHFVILFSNKLSSPFLVLLLSQEHVFITMNHLDTFNFMASQYN